MRAPRASHGALPVVLTGGCFQNARLAEGLVARAEPATSPCICIAQVPPGDGGIALGQAVVAAAIARQLTQRERTRMCLGVPGKVVAVDGSIATVDFWGVRKQVRLDVVDEPVQPGDYILNHVGYAIRRIPSRGDRRDARALRGTARARRRRGRPDGGGHQGRDRREPAMIDVTPASPS